MVPLIVFPTRTIDDDDDHMKVDIWYDMIQMIGQRETAQMISFLKIVDYLISLANQVLICSINFIIIIIKLMILISFSWGFNNSKDALKLGTELYTSNG